MKFIPWVVTASNWVPMMICENDETLGLLQSSLQKSIQTMKMENKTKLASTATLQRIVAYVQDEGTDDCYVLEDSKDKSEGARIFKTTCKDVFRGKIVKDKKCKKQKVPSPKPWQSQEIVDSANNLPCIVGNVTIKKIAKTDLGVEQAPKFKYIGCLTGDAAGDASRFDKRRKKFNTVEDALDDTCINRSSTSLCLQGFPFVFEKEHIEWKYQNEKLETQAWDSAMDKCGFSCLTRGFDAFALNSKTEKSTRQVECRCGATKVNTEIWGDDKVPFSLDISNNIFSKLKCTAKRRQYELKAYYIQTWYKRGGIPNFHNIHKSTVMEAHIASMVIGKQVSEDPDGKRLIGNPQANRSSGTGLLQQNATREATRKPRLWNMRENTRSKAWQSTVVIQYKFDSMIDDTRKRTFRDAAKLWEQNSCVRFQETTTPVKENGWVDVTVNEVNSCAALHGQGWGKAGFAGDQGGNVMIGEVDTRSYVNMGWCKGSQHVGALAHEIGHILGMYHEQQRPDATRKYRSPVDGRDYGPYIKVSWENMAGNSGYMQQYQELADAYTGSVDAGHLPYDFESIMHYGALLPDRKIAITPVDEFKNREFGTATKPSSGDVKQINDRYKCVPREKVCQDFGLKATTGNCHLDFGTCCASSPSSYEAGASCSIFLGDSPGNVHIDKTNGNHFNLQDGDEVLLAGQKYTGSVGPLGVVALRGVVDWRAAKGFKQSSKENPDNKGFQMCFPKACNPNADVGCEQAFSVASCNFQFPSDVNSDGTKSYCGGTFTQDSTASLGWVRHRGRTSTGVKDQDGETDTTGPDPINTADADGYYLYVEGTGSVAGQKARLLSQEFFLAAEDPRVLSFKTHMHGLSGMGTLSIKLLSLEGSQNMEKVLWVKDPWTSIMLPGRSFPAIGKTCGINATGQQVCKHDPSRQQWYSDSVKPSHSGVIGQVKLVVEVARGEDDADICIDALNFVDPNAPTTTTPPKVVLPTTTTTTPCFTIDSHRTPTMNGGTQVTDQVSSIACQEQCKKTNGCSFFTFYQSQKCHLHDSTARAATSHGAISGPPGCVDALLNPLGTVKKCFLSPDDNNACLTDQTLWPWAKAGEKCHDKKASCQSTSSWNSALTRRFTSADEQKRMHQCCPVTCGVCGCGLSDKSCNDCQDNSDMCLKKQDKVFSHKTINKYLQQ